MFTDIEYFVSNENDSDRMRLCYHPEGSNQRAVIHARMESRAEFLAFITEWYERASNAGFLITEIDECECGCAALKQNVRAAANVLMAEPTGNKIDVEIPEDDKIPF